MARNFFSKFAAGILKYKDGLILPKVDTNVKKN